jgi:subtilisin family serine protease/uncharacterized membrane protein
LKALVCAIGLLVLLPGAIDILAGGRESLAPEGIRLFLKAGTFDPLRESPPIPDDLKEDRSGGYSILQFNGPVQQAWKDQVTALGAVLYGYLPDYAFIARMTPSQEKAVRQLPHVRWTGAYQPGYKLNPALAREHGVITMYVMAFDDQEGLALRLAALGAAVLGSDPIGVRIRSDASLARAISFIPEVQWVDPLYGPDILNDNDARILRARQNNDGNFTFDGGSTWSYNNTKFEGIATGKGVVVCVQDSGVNASHVDLSSKKVAYKSYLGGAPWTDDQVGHGTHVAGTVAGTGEGQAGMYAGIAPEAMLIGIEAIDNFQIAPEAENGESIRWAYDNGADLVTNSWGETVTWGTYGALAVAYDRAVRDANASAPGNQSMIIIFAAGNEGFSGIREPGTAKNVITVGATGNNKTLSPTEIADFSSNGPTNDGRRKPDVMAPGAQVTSCLAGTTDQYIAHDGTSMAAPSVAGACADIIQYYRENYGHTPSPALMKALLANGADPLSSTYEYPGMGQGFGRVDVARTLLSDLNYKVFSEDQKVSLRTGEQQVYTTTVLTGSTPLKIMLAWTDPPGTPAANRELVNDLDLEITSPSGVEYVGNNFTNGQSRPNGARDNLNNLEGFFLKNPEPGTWTIKVNGTSVPVGPQDFGIVFSGDIDVSLDFVDLRVEEGPDVSEPEPLEGDTVTFSAAIRNNGTLPVNGTVLCRFTLNNNVIANISLPGFQENSTQNISASWVAVRGNHYILKVEVDPANQVREKNESNNAGSRYLDVFYHGLVVVATASQLEAEPGNPANFYMSVKNAGTANDTYSVVRNGAGPPPGWRENLTSDLLFIPKSSAADLNYTVWPPANATAGDRYSTSVTVVSEGNSTYNEAVNLTATVKQVFGMNFTTGSPPDIRADNGDHISCNFTINNTGNGKDFYTISYVVVGKSPGWAINLAGANFTLGPRRSSNFTVEMDIPPNAFANDSTTINITARNSDTAVQYFILRVTVRQSYLTELSVDSPTDTMAAGGSIDYRLTYRNGGNGNDILYLKATAPAGWNATLAKQFLVLQSRTEQIVDFVVSCPATSLSGTFPVSIISSGAGGNVVTAIVNVSVMQYYKVNIAVSPHNQTITQGELANFTVTVTNLGNGNDTFDVVTLNLIGGWSGVFTNSTVDIGPGQSAELTLTVSTLNDSVADNYTFTVKAISEGRPVVFNFTVVKLELLEAPKPPPVKPPNHNPGAESATGGFPWLLLLIFTVIIIGCACGVAAYAIHRARRKDAWQPTDVAKTPSVPPEGQLIAEPYYPPVEPQPYGSYAEPPPAPPQEAPQAPSSYVTAELDKLKADKEKLDAERADLPTDESDKLKGIAPKLDEDHPKIEADHQKLEEPDIGSTDVRPSGPRYERPDWQPDEPSQAPVEQPLPPSPPPEYVQRLPEPELPPPGRPGPTEPAPSRTEPAGPSQAAGGPDQDQLEDIMNKIKQLSKK